MSYFKSIMMTLLLYSSLSLQAETIWESSVQKALEKSALEKKPILIDLYADWCTYCKVLEKEIFPDKDVKAVLDKFITVRLDGEEFPNLRQKYAIEGYPTILFIDQYSNYLNKITGLATKEMVIDIAKKVLANPDLEQTLINKLKKKPDSSLIHLKLGTYYFQSGKLTEAKLYLKKSIKLATAAERKTKEDASFNLALVYFQESEWKDSSLYWKVFLEDFPKSENSLNAEMYYGISLKESGEKKLAEIILKNLRTRLVDPDDRKSIDEELEELRKGL